jgi:O-acetyl-ADP-ribose deacetylase (regulator of RNase III)
MMDDFISHSRENNNLMPRERSYQYNNSILRIVFGNILDSSADVIVSSDDSLLTMGGGVSRAILTRGGTEILTDAAKKIPAQLGDVVVTTSGQLSQKFIFNCITIDRN